MADCYEGDGSVGYWKARESLDACQRSLHCQKKVNQFLCLLVAFAAACSGRIIDLKPQYSNSNKWNNTEQPRGGNNTFTRYQSYHLLLYLLLSTNRHFYSLLKILPFFFITPYNSQFKSPFYAATKDTSVLVQRRKVHYQCHTQQYHLNRAMDRTGPNLVPARARSTNIRLSNVY